ncbi:MAG: hypothetical protein NZ902_00770 [Acidilobaceae archaeon]|nr:hypothetical protein [Acidilobaceae archaeon]MCX8165363.1 hypothetical protein [Acidilobaceae archaeon]MDW7973789.1 hypothetical protein [Sulfolobales archaeon]
MEGLRRALRLYNKYRRREAQARLVHHEGDIVKVEVKGSFCETCGIYDWLEDLVYVAREVGLELELVDAQEKASDKWLAVYRLKK